MASLANLTALLEHAISAEKVARKGLESFVNTIKDQVCIYKEIQYFMTNF